MNVDAWISCKSVSHIMSLWVTLIILLLPLTWAVFINTTFTKLSHKLVSADAPLFTGSSNCSPTLYSMYSMVSHIVSWSVGWIVIMIRRLRNLTWSWMICIDIHTMLSDGILATSIVDDLFSFMHVIHSMYTHVMWLFQVDGSLKEVGER